jgi:polysaccharide export outer membrane protein
MGKLTEIRNLVIIMIIMSGLYSCVPYKKLRYFNDLNDIKEPVFNPVKPKTISPFDRLLITVLSTDTQTADLLNFSTRRNSNDFKGFIVDEAGMINFPYVGNIEVKGLTITQAQSKITNAISSIIKDPELVISFMDNKVTVLGEFTNQGSYPLTKEFLTIYEALSLGGGLTQFADRKKIILLRNEENKLMHYRIDLSSSKILNSQLYYIFPNDIIIAEPLKSKTWSFQNSGITSITSAISVIVSLLTIYSLTKNNLLLP